jgi:predicted dehydrogenase
MIVKKLKWAILGPGSIAAEFAAALHEAQADLYAVGSRSLEKAQAFAAAHQAFKAYGDYYDMLADPAIDVVYIATPHANHYDFIMESLKNNKHVLCEKAITVNSEQLVDIVNLAEDNNLVVAEAMTIYHMPLYSKLRDLVRSGDLGQLKMIQVAFGSCKEYDINNRFFSPELAGGALLDIGTYALSFARFFLTSQPEEVLTTVRKFETGVDEQSGIILKNAQEEMAVITLTMRAKMPKRGIIACEKGYIMVDDYPRATQATVTFLDGRTEVIEAGEPARALVYEIEDMDQYIQDYRKQDTLELSLDVMNIMDKVRCQWGIRYPFE